MPCSVFLLVNTNEGADSEFIGSLVICSWWAFFAICRLQTVVCGEGHRSCAYGRSPMSAARQPLDLAHANTEELVRLLQLAQFVLQIDLELVDFELTDLAFSVSRLHFGDQGGLDRRAVIVELEFLEVLHHFMVGVAIPVSVHWLEVFIPFMVSTTGDISLPVCSRGQRNECNH